MGVTVRDRQSLTAGVERRVYHNCGANRRMPHEQPRHAVRQIQRKHVYALHRCEVCDLADWLLAQAEPLPLAFRELLALLNRVRWRPRWRHAVAGWSSAPGPVQQALQIRCRHQQSQHAVNPPLHLVGG
jgi:hypothetical protein